MSELNELPIPDIALAALGLSAWGAFILYATNAGASCALSSISIPDGITERLASSVLRSVTFQLRNSAEVAGLLGKNVKLEDPWWSE